MALGAKPGPPVQFQPEYKPAQGTEIDVEVVWIDTDGKKQRVKAQQWVKNIRTERALAYPWVFAGSMFLTDKEARERFYCADGGEFICVSNFPTAMLDLPVESSDANASLMYRAFAEKIPPRGTPIQRPPCSHNSADPSQRSDWRTPPGRNRGCFEAARDGRSCRASG